MVNTIIGNLLHRFSGLLTQKCAENPRMRPTFYSKFPPQVAHAQILVAFFVSADLKSGVHENPVVSEYSIRAFEVL